MAILMLMFNIEIDKRVITDQRPTRQCSGSLKLKYIPHKVEKVVVKYVSISIKIMGDIPMEFGSYSWEGGELILN